MASHPQEDRSLEEMELFDKEILACPYHYNKELRDNAPVTGTLKLVSLLFLSMS